MYLPDAFVETDEGAIAQLVADCPLACVVAMTGQGLAANHLPLVLHRGALIGHVARANDLHHLLPQGADVLAVFQGGQGYVSANDYPSKAQTHRQVPTWNYEVVHIHGTIHFQHDPAACRAAVALLTRRMETAVNGARAWRMSDAPRDYMEGMVANIVAFRIDIARVQAKSKLSQNKETPDRAGAAQGLAARGAGALAARIKA
jgi:transcriptional regulator